MFSKVTEENMYCLRERNDRKRRVDNEERRIEGAVEG